MIKPLVKTIIFDLNGTLVNTKEMLCVSRNNLFEELRSKLQIPEDLLLSEFRKFLNGNSMNPDIIENLPSIQSHINQNQLSRQNFKDKFESEIKSLIKLQSRVLDFLVQAKAHKVNLIVWSNSRSPFVKDIILRLNLDGLVDSVYCPEKKPDVNSSLDKLKLADTKIYEFSHEIKKPSVESLLYILENEEILADETILVGNGVDSDGLSVLNTGVRFILTLWGNVDTQTQQKIDWLIKDEKSAKDDLLKIQEQKKRAKDLVTPVAEIATLSALFSLFRFNDKEYNY